MTRGWPGEKQRHAMSARGINSNPKWDKVNQKLNNINRPTKNEILTAWSGGNLYKTFKDGYLYKVYTTHSDKHGAEVLAKSREKLGKITQVVYNKKTDIWMVYERPKRLFKKGDKVYLQHMMAHATILGPTYQARRGDAPKGTISYSIKITKAEKGRGLSPGMIFEMSEFDILGREYN